MVQVKTTFSALDPGIGPSGPSGEQVEVVPLIVQSTDPPGAVAPTIPETVALKVMAEPRAGLAGAEVTEIVGVALVTVTVSGADGASDE
jgi:hypothetical protein